MALAVLLACGVALAAAGDLDQRFGNHGLVTSNIGDIEEIWDVAVQPDDGKLVAAGYRAAQNSFALTRHNRDGTLDRSFGGDGLVTTNFTVAATVVVQPDGKLVTAGGAGAAVGDFALARFTPDGSLDESFGRGGKVATDFPGSRYAYALALQPDGKLVVGGSTYDPTTFALARYNTDGSLDKSFGGDDGVTTRVRDYSRISDLAVQDDGKVVVAGLSNYSGADDVGTGDFALARYNTDGTLDESFGGGDGKVITSLGSRYDGAEALAIRPDGKLIAGGWANNYNGFALARYNTDGSLDRNFSRDGKVITHFAWANASANDLVLQPDGKVVAAGSVSHYQPRTGRFALARYNPNGTLDASFGEEGKITTDFPGLGYNTAEALVRLGDGRLVAAGRADGGPRGEDSKLAMSRYLP
jgi:uncharacterized delta-60 repeat protein